MALWELSIRLKMNLNVDLIPIAKLTQSGLYLNIRHKTIELLEENSRENLGTLGFGRFLDTTPKLRSIKKEIDKLDILKLKSYAMWKTQLRKWKEVRLGEIFQNIFW